jgi:hypothetical protein
VNDFYSLLKQSIIDRDMRDAEARDGVYAQARRAMIRQLWAYQPALAQDDIDRRVDDFDTTVERIEAELAAMFAEDEVPSLPDDDGGMVDGWERDPAGDESAYGKRPYQPMPPRDGAEDAYAPSSAATVVTRGYQPAPAPPGAGDDAGAYEKPRRRFGDRWSADPGLPGHERPSGAGVARGGLGLSERDKVRLLIGTIAGLALVLIGFVVYVMLPGGEAGVTLPIDANREISDAATAARNATAALDVERSFVVFDGHDPTVFRSSPDNPVRLDSDAEGSFTRISSSTDSAGTRVTIGPGVASLLAGRNIRVIVSARASKDRGAANMRFAYQSGVAISHWQTANLANDYVDVALLWRAPTRRTSSDGNDYLIIEPGIPGDSTGADIRSIRVDVLAPSSG